MASSSTNNGQPPNGDPQNGGPPNGGPPNGGSPSNGGPLSGPPPNSDTTIPAEIRLFGASSFLILTILSLMANLLLLAVFIKGQKKFKSMPFFLIAYQMLLSDFMGLLVDVVLVVPITFAGYDSVILCVTFELKNVVLQAMPQLRMSLHDDNLINILTFAHTWVNIANNTVHAIVIFLFNSMAKEVFWALIGRKNNSTTTFTMTMAKTIQVKPAVIRSHTVANRA